jgi:Uma2 family endonuclease
MTETDSSQSTPSVVSQFPAAGQILMESERPMLPGGVPVPPTQDELPCSDGEPMETDRHVLQLELLRETLSLFWKDRDDFFAGGNMFLYFSLAQVKNQDFRGPDFFVVLGVPRGERKSWVVWEEGKGPDLVIEFLSDSTAEMDKGEKKLIYQEKLKVPAYFWYDPFGDDFAGFSLRDGVYEPISPDERGRLLSRKLGLALVRWQGYFRDYEAQWLRWETPEGKLLPTGEEMAERERARAEAAQQQASKLESLLARYRDRFGEISE